MRADLDDHPVWTVAVWTTLAVGVLVAWEVAFIGWDVRYWHVPSGSAWLTIVLAVDCSRPTRALQRHARAVNRAVLERPSGPLSRDDLSALERELVTKQRSWANRASIAFALTSAASMLLIGVFQYQDGSTAVAGTLLGAVGGLLAGQPIGRMVACGQLIQSLARQSLSVHATPGHVDGAAGLKPLGDYYIYQSLLLAISAIFCLTWSLIFIIDPSPENNWLRPWYLAALALFICFELAGFALPLSGVHEMMKRQKRDALAEADTVLAPEITQTRRELAEDLTPERRAVVRDRLDQLTRSYVEIETMPTWPVDRALRQRLTLGNLALIVPLVIQVITFTARR